MADNTGAWVEGDYGGNALKIHEGVKRAALTPRQALPTDADVPAEPIPTELDTLTADIDAFLNEPRPEEPAPVDDNLSATAGDYATVLESGVEDLAGGIGGGFEWLGTVVNSDTLKKLGSDAARFWTGKSEETKENLSPDAKELLGRAFLPEEGQQGAFDDLSSLPLKLAQSTPALMASMTPLGLAAKAGLGAKALMAIGAISEGGMATGFTAKEIGNAVDQLTDEDFKSFDRYNELREQDMTDAEARQAIRDDAIRTGGIISGAGSAALGGVGGAMWGKILNASGLDNFLPKIAPKTRFGAAGLALPTEGVQEFAQEGWEQISGNIGKRTYDEEQSLTEGSLEAAVGGGVLGAAAGATMAGVAGPNQAPEQAASPENEQPDTGADAIRQNMEPLPDEVGPNSNVIQGEVNLDSYQPVSSDPEPVADLRAQFGELMNKDSKRKAVYISADQISDEATQDLLEQVEQLNLSMEIDPDNNVLFAQDPKVTKRWKKQRTDKDGQQYDQRTLSEILGHEESKQDISGEPVVLETVDADENIVAAQVADEANKEQVAQDQQEGTATGVGTTVKTVEQGLADRAVAVDEEKQAAFMTETPPAEPVVEPTAAPVVEVDPEVVAQNVATNVSGDAELLAIKDLRKKIFDKSLGSKSKSKGVEALQQEIAKVDRAIESGDLKDGLYKLPALLRKINKSKIRGTDYQQETREAAAALLEGAPKPGIDAEFKKLLGMFDSPKTRAKDEAKAQADLEKIVADLGETTPERKPIKGKPKQRVIKAEDKVEPVVEPTPEPVVEPTPEPVVEQTKAEQIQELSKRKTERKKAGKLGLKAGAKKKEKVAGRAPIGAKQHITDVPPAQEGALNQQSNEPVKNEGFQPEQAVEESTQADEAEKAATKSDKVGAVHHVSMGEAIVAGASARSVTADTARVNWDTLHKVAKAMMTKSEYDGIIKDIKKVMQSVLAADNLEAAKMEKEGASEQDIAAFKDIKKADRAKIKKEMTYDRLSPATEEQVQTAGESQKGQQADADESANLTENSSLAQTDQEAATALGAEAARHAGGFSKAIKIIQQALRKAYNSEQIDFATVNAARANVRGSEAAMGLLGVNNISLNDLITELNKLLPKNHPQRQILTRFSMLAHDVPVILYDTEKDINSGSQTWDITADEAHGLVGNRIKKKGGVDPNANYMGLNADKLIPMIAEAMGPNPSLAQQANAIGTVIMLVSHEAGHVASVRAMGDPAFADIVSRLDDLRQGLAPEIAEHYGFTNTKEFVAEGWSNPTFQKVLMETPLPKQYAAKYGTREKLSSYWDAFVQAVGRLVGITPTTENAFTELVSLSRKLMEDADTAQARFEQQKEAGQSEFTDEVSAKILPTYEKVAESFGGHRVNRLARITEAAKDIVPRGVLGWHQLDQIFRRFGSRFGQPMKDYQTHLAHKQAIVTQERKLADNILRDWHRAAAGAKDKKLADKFGQLMGDSTIAQLDVSVAFSHPHNAHAWKNKSMRAEHATLRARYKAIASQSPKLAATYVKVGKFFRHQRTRTQRYAIDTLLNSYPALASSKVVAKRIIGAGSKAEVKSALLGAARGRMNSQQIDAAVKHFMKLKKLTEVKGYYAPLRRYGDYVVSATRKPAPKRFATKAEAKQYIQQVEANQDPTLQPNSTAKLDKNDKLLVHLEESIVVMAESQAEANTKYEQIKKEFAGGTVEAPRNRQRSNFDSGSKQYGRLVQQIKSNVGNASHNASIDAAMIQLLAEESVRKSELARKGVQGFSTDMSRAFAERAMAGSWTMADLRVGRDQAEAMAQLQETADNHPDRKERLTLGKVVLELKKREEGDIADREPTPIRDALTKAGYYWYLASPSYIIQNASQVPLVTLPYLGAKFGLKANAAVLSNSAQVFGNTMGEIKSTGLGLKEMPEHFVDNMITKWGGNPDPNNVQDINNLQTKGDMLRALLDRGRIDATLIQELYSSIRGQDTGKMTTAMGYATTWAKAWPQIVEQVNRVVTAGAAYDLAKSKNKSELEAMYIAEEAVLETQLDYSNTNRARHMKLFGMGRIVFMFKTYSQGILALQIKSFAAMIKGGEISRKEGRKTLLGLMASHTLAAGVLGGIMSQPLRLMYDLLSNLWEDDDDPRSLDDRIENLAREVSEALLAQAGIDQKYAEDVAEAVTRGLPRAGGVDFHGSLGMQNLLFMTARDTDSWRDKAENFIAQAGGPLAAAGVTAFGGLDYYEKGQYSKMAESILPKGIRNIIRSYRFSEEGITDFGGKNIMPAEELNYWNLFTQAGGVPPAKTARMYEERNSVRSIEQRQLNRKKNLAERWRNAVPSDRHLPGGINEEIRAFNAANPNAAITMDSLFRGAMEANRTAAEAAQGQFARDPHTAPLYAPWTNK